MGFLSNQAVNNLTKTTQSYEASQSYLDGVQINIGSGSDLDIFHENDNSYIRDDGAGSLNIIASDLNLDSTGNIIMRDTDDSDAELFKLNTSTRALTLGNSSDEVFISQYGYHRIVKDGSNSANYFSVGAGDDLKIYHTGSVTYFYNTAGTIEMQSTTGSEMVFSQTLNDTSKTFSFKNTNNGYNRSNQISIFANQLADSGTNYDSRLNLGVSTGTTYAYGYLQAPVDESTSATETIRFYNTSTNFFKNISMAGDDIYAYFGAGNDASLRFDGSYLRVNSPEVWIDAEAGSIILDTGANLVIRDEDDSNETLFDLDTTNRTLTIGATDGDDDVSTDFYGVVDMRAKVSANLNLISTSGSGSPAQTTFIKMRSEHGGVRGQGIFFEDSGASNEQWYAGLPYAGSFNVYQIGFDRDTTSGDGSNYQSNAIAKFIDNGTTKSVQVLDNTEIQFGTNTDTIMYHDDTDFNIKNSTGDFKIYNDNSSGTLQTWFTFDASANAIQNHHDVYITGGNSSGNVARLFLQSDGSSTNQTQFYRQDSSFVIDIEGSDPMIIDYGGEMYKFNSSGHLEVGINSSAPQITIGTNGDNNAILKFAGDLNNNGSGTRQFVTGLDYSDNKFRLNAGSSFDGTLNGLEMDSSGNVILSGTLTADANGSASATFIRHPSNADSGIFFDGTDVIAIASEGSAVLTVYTDNFLVPPVYSATTSSSANVNVASSSGKLARSTSSQRYKTNLQNIPYERTAFHNLTPRLFESTISGEEGIERWGLIAEDVQTAFGNTIIEFNENDQVENFDTRGIIAVMYQEIKNLKEEIDELRGN